MAQTSNIFELPRFSVEVRGSGPDVLLVPGLASPRAVFDDVAARLEDRYRLHLVQVAGYAGEPARANAEGELLPALAADLSAYAKEIGVRRYIGHSLGGLLGLMIAAAQKDAFERLMVIDALPFYAVLLNPLATPDSARVQATMMRETLMKAPEPMFRSMMEQTAARSCASAEHRPAIVDWSMTSDRGVLVRAFCEEIEHDMRPKLTEIATPTVILYAHHLSMGPAAMVDALYNAQYAGLEGKMLARVDGAMHFLMFDQREQFGLAVKGFLAS